MSGLSESVVERMQLATNNVTDAVMLQVNDRSSDGEGTSTDPSTLFAKILAILVLLLVTCLCGFLPFALNYYFKWTSTNGQSPRSATIVKCLLYFGGGVLFATTFLHLLPEVQEVCDDLLNCQMIPDLPFDLATVLMCFGFFLMYLIEEIMHTYMHHRQNAILKKDKDGAAFERGHSVRRSVLVKENGNFNCSSERIESVVSQSSLGSTVAIVDIDSECCGKEFVENVCNNGGIRQCSVMEINTKKAFDHNEHKHDQDRNHHHHNHEEDEHNHSHMPTLTSEDNLASSLRGLGLVLALSLHELFEGLAIGLESSSSAVWFTCAAVGAHKLVLAFCVGMELVVARTRQHLAIIYIITFSIVSPIGIAIGILVTLHANTSTPSLASAILQGIACGTLLYVVFFEILTKNHAGWWAYVTLLLGFCLMFGLQILGSDADSHSGVEYTCAS